jgi:hypothetical protein
MNKRWQPSRIINLKLVLLVTLVFFYACEDLTDSLSARDNVVDTWKCVETDTHGASTTFAVEVQANSTDLNGIKIYNINNLGDNFYINGSVTLLSLSIPEQTKSGFTIKGSGIIKSGYKEIDLEYSVDDNGDKLSYTAVLTKF